MFDHDAVDVFADSLSLLDRTMSYTLGSLELVTDESLAWPSPCVEWDLRALLSHMHDSLVTLGEAAGLGWIGPRLAEPAGQSAAVLVAGVKRNACELFGAWASMGRPATVSVGQHQVSSLMVAGVGALEVAVHGWDVGRACGRQRVLPVSLAEALLDMCPLLVSDEDRLGRFAAPVVVSASADPTSRLLAFLGRDSGPLPS
ncbi:TIGR03086 family metal-binding protein [Phytoactinopolyspora limicola]|uniref:TIGR03086 family metal-binding protein n=1 Tax=Phytoactinopolyspora limicola TaxID=2715536 RepID=UPI00140847D6|nr:TIGR03086 family metal-binding protein [Phytoactinopolyspora limicola]